MVIFSDSGILELTGFMAVFFVMAPSYHHPCGWLMDGKNIHGKNRATSFLQTRRIKTHFSLTGVGHAAQMFGQCLAFGLTRRRPARRLAPRTGLACLLYTSPSP